MGSSVHIKDGSPEFEALTKRIRSAVEGALEKAQIALGAGDVTVFVEENPDSSIPETGSGGFTPDSHSIFVYIDPQNPHLQTDLEGVVRSTVTHEFHHAIRNRTIPYQTDTLLGGFVTEGLADHFDIEINGGAPPPWSRALTPEEIIRVSAQAQPEFANRSYDHQAWFFGSSQLHIPRWAGYSIGFKLVGDYLQRTGTKASELVTMPAENFLPV